MIRVICDTEEEKSEVKEMLTAAQVRVAHGSGPTRTAQERCRKIYHFMSLLKSGLFVAESMAVNLNDFAAAVHENAVAHGWWEEPKSIPEILMLCVSELAEAMEVDRQGLPVLHVAAFAPPGLKPEGLDIELADCILRILDFCAYSGIDIEKALRAKHEYNIGRPYKHGGKNY